MYGCYCDDHDTLPACESTLKVLDSNHHGNKVSFLQQLPWTLRQVS